MEKKLTKEEVFAGNLDAAVRSKENLKVFIVLTMIILGNLSWIWVMVYYIYLEEHLVFDWGLMAGITVAAWGIPVLVALIANNAYLKTYLRTFQYAITVDSINIQSGVFTKNNATIPFSRIQNITVTQGIFDRKFGIYTVKIETAGASNFNPQTGKSRAEGYLPGLRDPKVIQEKIKEQVARFSKIPSGLEDKVFASKDIAFDNFISYIISKMADGQGLKTRIAQFREKKGWAREQLADEVGFSVEVIKFLEEGRYNPSLNLAYAIAKVLGTRVEDLFEFGG